MKKKLTLAMSICSLLAAAPLSAQNVSSNGIQMYGLIDVGYFYDKTQGKSSINAIDSGNKGGSRWGFKGSEDLGNGYKASFVLEGGFKADTGAKDQNERLFGRYSYLALSGGFGEARMGRQWVLGREYGGMFSPFGIAWSRSGIGTTFGYNDGDYGLQGIADNMFMYRSPKFGNVDFAVGYSVAKDGDEKAGSSNNDRMTTVGLRYQDKSLRVGISYESLNADRSIKNRKDSSNLQIGGNYDFEVIRVYAGYGRMEDMNAGPSNKVETDDAFTVGVRVPVSAKGSLLASYQETSDSNIWNGAVGFNYDLSKRTSLYAFTNYGETEDTKTKDDVARTQFSFGLSHSF